VRPLRRVARGGGDAVQLGGERDAALLDEVARRARRHRRGRVLPLEPLLVLCPAAAPRLGEARDEAARRRAAASELGPGAALPKLVHVEQLLAAAKGAEGVTAREVELRAERGRQRLERGERELEDGAVEPGSGSSWGWVGVGVGVRVGGWGWGWGWG
jgi:hypothetical protein